SAKIPLGALEVERLALKERFALNARWIHHQGGEYIVNDVVRLVSPFSGAPGVWSVLCAPAGETAPPPFVLELTDFLSRFTPAEAPCPAETTSRGLRSATWLDARFLSMIDE